VAVESQIANSEVEHRSETPEFYMYEGKPVRYLPGEAWICEDGQWTRMDSADLTYESIGMDQAEFEAEFGKISAAACRSIPGMKLLPVFTVAVLALAVRLTATPDRHHQSNPSRAARS